MAIKINISPEVQNAVDSSIGVGVNSGPGIGIDVVRPGDVSISIDRRPPVQIELKAKRTLDGNIMIMDHQSIDIVVMPEKSKFLAIAKNIMHDDVYGAQDRLGSFLTKSGIVDPTSIRSGNIFGSMEYKIIESKIPGVDETQACLYSIYKYIQGERPYFELTDEYDQQAQDHLLEPSDEFTTNLGDVPHSDNKGGISSKIRPFGYQYNYSLIREEEEV